MSETLEIIRTTTVDLRIHVDGNDVVVDVDPEQAELGAISKRLEIPEERRTEEFMADLWVEELTYPECTEAEQTHEDLVGAEALIAAIREVGDTAIAALIGMDDFLAAARSVHVDHHETGISLTVSPLRLNLATGLLNPDPAERTASLTLHAQPVESHAGATQTYTWPSTQAPDRLPDLSDQPALALALRLIGGGE